MASFKDMTGDDWTILLRVDEVNLVKKLHGVNLAGIFDKDSKDLAALSDPEKMVDVVWTLVEDQAAAKKLDPRGFARLLDEDSLEDMAEAIGRAVADFSRRRKAARHKVMDKSAKVKAAVMKKGEVDLQKLDQMDDDALADQVIARLTGTVSSKDVSSLPANSV
jgi:uncharacterized protein with GYD domain